MYHLSTFILFFCTICDVLSFGVSPRLLKSSPYLFIPNKVFNIKYVKDDIVVRRCLAIALTTEWMISSAYCLLREDAETMIFEIPFEENGNEIVKRYYNTQPVIHPNFDKNTGRHDIGLLRVIGGTGLGTQLIKKAIKPFPTFPNIKASVTGLNVNSSASYTIPPEAVNFGQFSVMLYPISECKVKYPQLRCLLHLDGRYQFCGHHNQNFGDLCESDAGAPVYNGVDSVDGIIGIYSNIFAVASGEKHYCDEEHGHPFIFTQIWPYLSWFSQVTRISYDDLRDKYAPL